MNNYIKWLNNDANLGYFFLTFLLLGSIVFMIIEIVTFIEEIIEKNKKVEELEKELKKMKGKNERKK